MEQNKPDPRIPSQSGAAESTSAVAPGGPARSTVPSHPTVPEQPARPLQPSTSAVGASEGAQADAARARQQAEADEETKRLTEGTPPPADEVLEQTGSHPLGATLGALGGASAGAVIGIAAGPVGSLVGAIGGAVAGGLMGSGAAGDKPIAGPVTEAPDQPADAAPAGTATPTKPRTPPQV